MIICPNCKKTIKYTFLHRILKGVAIINCKSCDNEVTLTTRAKAINDILMSIITALIIYTFCFDSNKLADNFTYGLIISAILAFIVNKIFYAISWPWNKYTNYLNI